MTPGEFRALRVYLGLTQAAMGKAIGVPQSRIAKIEAGTVPVPEVDRAKLERKRKRLKTARGAYEPRPRRVRR